MFRPEVGTLISRHIQPGMGRFRNTQPVSGGFSTLQSGGKGAMAPALDLPRPQGQSSRSLANTRAAAVASVRRAPTGPGGLPPGGAICAVSGALIPSRAGQ
jgi:hypothetical protein